MLVSNQKLAPTDRKEVLSPKTLERRCVDIDQWLQFIESQSVYVGINQLQINRYLATVNFFIFTTTIIVYILRTVTYEILYSNIFIAFIYFRYRTKFKELKKSLVKMKEQREKDVREEKLQNLITPDNVLSYGKSRHVKDLQDKLKLLQDKEDTPFVPSFQESLKVSCYYFVI